jgi:hypothetical protein
MGNVGAAGRKKWEVRVRWFGMVLDRIKCE